MTEAELEQFIQGQRVHGMLVVYQLTDLLARKLQLAGYELQYINKAKQIHEHAVESGNVHIPHGTCCTRGSRSLVAETVQPHDLTVESGNYSGSLGHRRDGLTGTAS